MAVCAFAQTAGALFEKARAAQVAGRLEEAESSYRQYLKQYRPTPEVLANLGALLARRENYSEAIRYYEQALKLDPSLTPLHLNLGLAHFKQGRPAPAIAEFDLLLKTDPTNRQAAQLRGMALLEAERYVEAEQQFRELMPGDLSILLGLSTALLRQGKSGEARAVLEPVLSRTDSADVQLTLGQALLNDGQINEALAAFEQARKLNPNLPLLRLNIGAAYWRQRKTEEALAEWRAEYQANPNSVESIYTLGAALALNAASAAEAERLLRKAVAMRPNNARANYQLAKLIWQTSKNREAAVFLDRATKADGEFREAFILYGTVLQSLGRKPEAAQAFARAKQLSEQEVSRQRDLFSESQ